MSKSKYPQFQKVDDNTIKITVEKAEDVPIDNMIRNKEILLEQKASIEKQLETIQTILDTAEELGIVPKPKDKDPKKEK